MILVRRCLLVVLAGASLSAFALPAPPSYSIDAIRYATVPQFPLRALVMGAPESEKLDIAMVVWLIRGSGKVILFDTGFHREKWMRQFTVTDYVRPDEALRAAGVPPEAVTDVVISHAHWDHMGGIDLFPQATAWQPGGRHGGIDPEDIAALVHLNTEGRLRLVDGDDVEILPGLRAYTGARHTFASQYIRVGGEAPVVLASDNCYLYRNLEARAASATFTPEDRDANLRAQERMIELAGSRDRVVPGHDPHQFQRYPAHAATGQATGNTASGAAGSAR